MRRLLSAVLVCVLALWPGDSWAVGSITITYAEARTVRKVTLAWTSDASGNVSANLTKELSGNIQRVAFIPGSGGTQPTDLYDIVLLDSDGVDVLAAGGANLSNATKSQSIVDARAIDGTLELQVSNAGNAKTGTVALYLR